MLRYTLTRIKGLLLQAPVGLETHGPLGTLWVSAGLIAFYIALIWLNSLLGLFLTPLFVIPQTRLLEYLQKRKRSRAAAKRSERTAR